MNYRSLLILGLAGCLFSLSGSAAAPDDCDDPFTYASAYNPPQLRQVAKKCGRTEIAEYQLKGHDMLAARTRQQPATP